MAKSSGNQSYVSKTILCSENLSLTSAPIDVTPGGSYAATTRVVGIHGGRYSAYFTVIILDQDGKELLRKIRWLNDFSGSLTDYTLVTKVPSTGHHAVTGYRVNSEGSLISDCLFEFLDPSCIALGQVKDSSTEVWDEMYQYLSEPNPNLQFEPLTKLREDDMERRVAWIFGSPRTGSTWLALRLLAHQEHIVWDEPMIGAHLGANFRWKFPSLGSDDRLFDEASRNFNYFFLGFYATAWRPILRSLITNRIYAQFGEDALSKIIIVKEPNGSAGIDIVLDCMPKSKAIFLVRDGRDVVDSTLDMHRENSWADYRYRPFSGQEDRYEAIAFYSELWRKWTEVSKRAYQNHDPKLRLLVRYEDLRFDTSRELRRIYEFLGTRISDKEIDQMVQTYSFENVPRAQKGPGKFARKASPGGWRLAFTAQQQELVRSILSDTLRELGYRS